MSNGKVELVAAVPGPIVPKLCASCPYIGECGQPSKCPGDFPTAPVAILNKVLLPVEQEWSQDGIELFQFGAPVRLHSGVISEFKIECDALSRYEIAGLATLIAKFVRPFHYVYGVPRGGLRLAEALKLHATGEEKFALIVDDVLTSGGSMTESRHRLMAAGWAACDIQGAVIFARGVCPDWVTPLFQMTESYGAV